MLCLRCLVDRWLWVAWSASECWCCSLCFLEGACWWLARGVASLWCRKLVLREIDFFSLPRVPVSAEVSFCFDKKCLINFEVVGENCPLS